MELGCTGVRQRGRKGLGGERGRYGGGADGGASGGASDSVERPGVWKA